MKERFNFGGALIRLREGKRVERSGWNGKGMWIALVQEWQTTHVRMDGLQMSPFIVMKTTDDKFVPWLASQTDVLAEDWSEAD